MRLNLRNAESSREHTAHCRIFRPPSQSADLGPIGEPCWKAQGTGGDGLLRDAAETGSEQRTKPESKSIYLIGVRVYETIGRLDVTLKRVLEPSHAQTPNGTPKSLPILAWCTVFGEVDQAEKCATQRLSLILQRAGPHVLAHIRYSKSVEGFIAHLERSHTANPRTLYALRCIYRVGKNN